MRLQRWWAEHETRVLRFAILLMSVAALVWLIYQFWRLLVPGPPLWPTSPKGAVDLIYRHAEVHRWFAGLPVYGEMKTATYPPASYAMLWPLVGWLELAQARWLWACINLAGLGWLAHLLVRESGADRPAERLFIALLPLAAYSTGATIGNGQLIVALMPLLIASPLRVQRARDWQTDLLAALLMLLALVKPTVAAPFFWILLFASGRLLPAAVATLGYILLTVIAASFQNVSVALLVEEWLQKLAPVSSGWGSANVTTLLAWLDLGPWTQRASVLILLALGLWVFRHRRRDPWIVLGVTAMVARFWTYHGWYDDLLLLLPMITLYRTAKRPDAAGIGSVAAVLFAIMLPFMLAPGGQYLLHGFWKTLYMSAQQATWLVAFVYLLFLAERERRRQFRGAQARPGHPGQEPVDFGLGPQ